MTAAELAQALLALCSAVVAVGLALAILVPAEPIAPGQFGDHRAAVARTLLPIWREPLDLPAATRVPDGTDVVFTGRQPDAVLTTPARLSQSDVDRLFELLTHDPNREA